MQASVHVLAEGIDEKGEFLNGESVVIVVVVLVVVRCVVGAGGEALEEVQSPNIEGVVRVDCARVVKGERAETAWRRRKKV